MELSMSLAEELRDKYALTSLKIDGSRFPLLAINEALEAAAQIAEQARDPNAAKRIRSLKWTPVPAKAVTVERDHDSRGIA
jgi:hypothetical protein